MNNQGKIRIMVYKRQSDIDKFCNTMEIYNTSEVNSKLKELEGNRKAEVEKKIKDTFDGVTEAINENPKKAFKRTVNKES